MSYKKAIISSALPNPVAELPLFGHPLNFGGSARYFNPILQGLSASAARARDRFDRLPAPGAARTRHSAPFSSSTSTSPSIAFPPLSLYSIPPFHTMDQRHPGSSKVPRSMNQDGRRGKISRPSVAVSAGTDRGQYEHSAQPPTAPHEQNQSGVVWQYQAPYQEPLTYRQSSNSRSSPSTSSVEQSVLGEQSQGSAFQPPKSFT